VVASISFGSELVAFIIGAGTVSVGHLIAHRFATQRERRSEIVGVLDRTIQAYVAADRAISQFISHVGTGADLDVILASADGVSDREVEMRAARFALDIRLEEQSELGGLFLAAQGKFTESYLSLGDAITRRGRGERVEGPHVVEDASRLHHEYRENFDRAMDLTRELLAAGRL
jgi:hypothetical protein